MAEKKKTKVKVERMEDDGIEKIFDDLFNEDSYETEEDIDVFPEEKEEIEIEQDAKEDDDLGFPEVTTPKDDKSEKADTPKAKKKDDKDIKIEELTDRLLRTVAEFDNYRKRTEKEKEARFDLGMKSMIERILPIVDNFERGLATVSEEDKLEHTIQNIYHYQLYELDYGLKRLQEDILFYEKIIEKEMNQ